MGRGEHQVALAVDRLGFATGSAAPQQKDQPLAAAVELVDDGVGKRLPALPLVGMGPRPSKRRLCLWFVE